MFPVVVGEFSTTATRNCSDKTQRGIAMIEYLFLAMLILLVCIIGVTAIGLEVQQKFENPELKNGFASVQP